MESLKKRILGEGRILGNGILKVDSFLNHQIDSALMMETGIYLADRFRPLSPTKVLTAEVSGIAPAVMTGFSLGIPVVFARKSKPVTMPQKTYSQMAPSHTKNQMTELSVSSEVLGQNERVVIIDDFLASGKTLMALARIVGESGSMLIGIGAVIEKTFEEGRTLLSALGVPIVSAAAIKEMTADSIILE